MEWEEANGFFEELERAAKKCRECGACASVCDISRALNGVAPGIAVRGALLGREDARTSWFIPRCSLCRACVGVCPEHIDTPRLVVAARSFMRERGCLDMSRYAAMYVDYDANAISLFRDTYGLDYPFFPEGKYQVLYLPGCSLLNEGPELTSPAVAWLGEALGVKVGLMGDCCGMPLYEMGLLERAKAFEDGLWQKIHATGATTLVLACPNCMGTLAERGKKEGVQVVSIYEIMARAGFRAPVVLDGTITIHDSCPARFTDLGKYVRAILSDYDVVEMEHSGCDSICCGSGGAVAMFDPTVSSIRAERRISEFKAAGAKYCVTYCMSSCGTLTGECTFNLIKHVLELCFNVELDHERYQNQVNAMWSGDMGTRNAYRLEHAQFREGLV